MKRAVILLGMAVVLATPAAAQWLGEPVWNSPKAGTGVTISGDYARPDSAYGKGNVWGGRASLGLSTITLTAGVATWSRPNGAPSVTSVGGNVGFRLIGGSLIPVAVNMQLGGTGTTSTPKATTLIGAVGVSVPLPTPGFSIEPYFSPGVRYRNSGGGTNTTNFGYALGANLGFGLLGVHLAYDWEHNKSNGASGGVFGVGLHAGFHLPLGM